MASTKRDQLVDTALQAFYQHGFHATGIDTIIEKAGVARMTLYKHFKSKDALILAVLQRRDERFRTWFMDVVERSGATPAGRLIAMFDALEVWFAGRDFAGCMFINAAAEFADPDHPAHQASAEHKRLMLDYVRGVTRAAGAAAPERLADGLMLLMEGAIVMRHVGGDIEAARRAKEAAMILIDAAGLAGQPR